MEEILEKPYVIGLDMGGTNSVFGYRGSTRHHHRTDKPSKRRPIPTSMTT